MALAAYIHEEFGTHSFGLLYGTLLTFGAVGFYGFNDLFLPGFFEMYEEKFIGQKWSISEFGEWNYYLFGICAILAFISAVVTFISSYQINKRDKASD